jgi:hypothetical protein
MIFKYIFLKPSLQKSYHSAYTPYPQNNFNIKVTYSKKVKNSQGCVPLKGLCHEMNIFFRFIIIYWDAVLSVHALKIFHFCCLVDKQNQSHSFSLLL